MTEPAIDVIWHALELATRAPSLHNSQPWRWVAYDGMLQLYADRARIGHGTDRTGKEVLLSCGAVLDHLRVAMAAAGWDSLTERFPNPNNRDHLATVEFARAVFVTDAQRARAAAIARRRTDRLAFGPPPGWQQFETVLRATIAGDGTDLDVLDEDARPQLADASRLTEQLRRYDSSYHAELAWWTAQPPSAEAGIPPAALASGTEAQRVDVSRVFPAHGEGDRRADVVRDHAKIVVLSSYDDSRRSMLGCGEVLSTVLLEATMADLATCTLTHMIEVDASREIVRRLTKRTAEPQVLVRVGTAPPMDQPPPLTPRRPVTEVLEVRRW